MAHVILGLLLVAPRSLYGLVKGFEESVALFYSASSGSIKRALDGLRSRGHVEVARVEPGGRGTTVYRVTAAGRREFDAWMTAEPTGSDLDSAVLPRLHFLGLLPHPERPAVLRRIRVRVEQDLARLVALDAHLDTVDIPAEHRDVAAYQRASLDYGIASLRLAVDWFADRIDRIDRAEC